MIVNTNLETGIRYGVIYLNSLNQDTADQLFFEGVNVSEEEAYTEAEREILETIKNEIFEAVKDGEEPPYDEDDIDREVERRLERWGDQLQIDEPFIEGEHEGVKYQISWLGGAPMLWVLESPCCGKYKLCSPCVPNAGDLDSPSENGEVCYDVPIAWRQNDVA